MRITLAIILLNCACIVLRSAADQPSFALSFDGVDDVVEFSGAPEIHGPHTVEAWVRPRQLQYANWVFIFGQGHAEQSDNCYRGSWLIIDRDVPRPGFAMDPAGCKNQLQLLQPASIDEWVHLTGTFDGQTMRLYVNGVPISSRPAVHSSSSRMSAGAVFSSHPDFFGYGLHFKGDLDNLRFWRKARTSEEILSTMNRRLTGNECGLVGEWRFDEGAGQLAYPTNPTVPGVLGASTTLQSQDPTWVLSDLIFAPARCEGDIDDNGFVDDEDFVLFVKEYQLLDCFADGTPPNCPSDLNGDCYVNDADFSRFAAAYNQLICGIQ